MSLVANKDAILNIDAPTIIIKVIDRNGRKKITTISGLFVESKSGISPYFSKEVHKRIISELGKKCAARATIIGVTKNYPQKIIQIQGDNKEVIMDYLLKMYIPKEKIKIAGI